MSVVQKMTEMKPDDCRVFECLRAHGGDGASAAQIARASLGHRAKNRKYRALELIGLSIATRLIGTGDIAATRSNRFVLARREVAA